MVGSLLRGVMEHMLLISGYLALSLTGFFHPVVLLSWFLLLGVSLGSRWRFGRALRKVVFPTVLIVGLLDLSLVSPSDRVLLFATFAAFLGQVSLVVLGPAAILTSAFPLFQLLAAAALSSHVTFGISVIAFILCSTLAMMVRVLDRPRDLLFSRVSFFSRAGEGKLHPMVAIGSGPPGRQALALALFLSVMTLMTAFFLFFIIPRYGAGWFFAVDRETRRMVGFSEQVKLGSIADLKDDDTVVMRVKLEDRDGPWPKSLKFRGVALDDFDGTTWKETPGDEYTFVDQAKGLRESFYTVDTSLSVGQPLLRQRIFLSPDLEGVLFGATRPARVWGKFVRLRRTRNQSLLVKFPAFTNRSYHVFSDVGRPPWSRLENPDPTFKDADPLRYLKLPPSSSPELVKLATSMTAGKSSRITRVLAIESALRSRYTYSTAQVLMRADTPPVEHFLFSSRTGHCEYFASGMAVLLRSLKIPTRVVNGFVQGEYNSLGHYYLISSRDAHSWVEVFFPGVGWVDFDPTPPREESGISESLSHRIRLLWDSMKMFWQVYVVDYHLLDQVATMRALLSAARDLYRGKSREETSSSSVRVPGLILFIVGLSLGLLVLWRFFFRLANSGEKRRMGEAERIYRSFLDVMKSRGLPRAPPETPREFRERAMSRWPRAEVALSKFTAWYEEMRFGRNENTLPGPGAGERLLEDVKKALTLPDKPGAPDSSLETGGR